LWNICDPHDFYYIYSYTCRMLFIVSVAIEDMRISKQTQ
jgi:hypothetical protein